MFLVQSFNVGMRSKERRGEKEAVVGSTEEAKMNTVSVDC